MKRQAFAASLSQAVPAVIGMAIPALYLMTPVTGGGSLANLGRAAVFLTTTLFNYLLAVAAALAAAG